MLILYTSLYNQHSATPRKCFPTAYRRMVFSSSLVENPTRAWFPHLQLYTECPILFWPHNQSYFHSQSPDFDRVPNHFPVFQLHPMICCNVEKIVIFYIKHAGNRSRPKIPEHLHFHFIGSSTPLLPFLISLFPPQWTDYTKILQTLSVIWSALLSPCLFPYSEFLRLHCTCFHDEVFHS